MCNRARGAWLQDQEFHSYPDSTSSYTLLLLTSYMWPTAPTKPLAKANGSYL